MYILSIPIIVSEDWYLVLGSEEVAAGKNITGDGWFEDKRFGCSM